MKGEVRLSLPRFTDYMPRKIVLELSDKRTLELVEPDLQDIADGECIVGKPFDEWCRPC